MLAPSYPSPYPFTSLAILKVKILFALGIYRTILSTEAFRYIHVSNVHVDGKFFLENSSLYNIIVCLRVTEITKGFFWGKDQTIEGHF